MDTIGHTGFGYEFGSFERTELHPIVTTLLRAMLQARARDGRVPGQEHLYRQEDEQFAADVDFLIARVDDVIRARKDSGDTSTDDLLGLMLNAQHPESGQKLVDANIRKPDDHFPDRRPRDHRKPTVLRLVRRGQQPGRARAGPR